MISSKQFCWSVCDWNKGCSPFLGVITSSALSLQAWISDSSKICSSSMFATKISPFHIPPSINASPRNIPSKTFLQNCGALTCLWWKQNDTRSSHQRKSLVLGMVLRIAVHKVSHRLIRGLEHFAVGSNIPWNQPTIVRPSRIATALQKFLPLFCVLFFQQYHLAENNYSYKY